MTGAGAWRIGFRRSGASSFTRASARWPRKSERIAALARALSRFIDGADPARAARAGTLCKADLVSEMVGEFPDLQGVMGRYYARDDGEAPAVSEAIAEHYAPQGPGERCPTAPVSVTVGLADKLDTLAAFFAIGEKPTGSKDPFALRRSALGAIRLILENRLRLAPPRRARGRACRLRRAATAGARGGGRGRRAAGLPRRSGQGAPAGEGRAP